MKRYRLPFHPDACLVGHHLIPMSFLCVHPCYKQSMQGNQPGHYCYISFYGVPEGGTERHVMGLGGGQV